MMPINLSDLIAGQAFGTAGHPTPKLRDDDDRMTLRACLNFERDLSTRRQKCSHA